MPRPVASPAAATSIRLMPGVSVHVPRRHTPVGVVILHSLFHGSAEPVAQGWSTESDKRGFVAIYPTRGSSWNAGLCCSAAAKTKRDDVSWLTAVINQARAHYKLNTVYLVGDSNGGMMVERLVAERPRVSARFAVWGASPEMPTPGHWSGTGFLFTGSGDTTIPSAGGFVRIGGTAVYMRSPQTTGRWLIGAHLKRVVIQGQGHAPPRDWPARAWQALSSGKAP